MKSDPITMMELFMEAFGGSDTEAIDDIMWLLYEAALNSEMSDSWDHERRPEIFLFTRLITDFFKGFIQIYTKLSPVLQEFSIDYEVKEH